MTDATMSIDRVRVIARREILKRERARYDQQRGSIADDHLASPRRGYVVKMRPDK